MIVIKNQNEIDLMKVANNIIAQLLDKIVDHIKPGITTMHLDKIATDFIEKNNAKPNFLGVGGYPSAICASIDHEVIHGIPSKKRFLEEGQIISIDVGAVYEGLHADAARTFAVGKISKEKQNLIEVTEKSFFKGMEILKDGARIGDLGFAIQNYVESNGYSVVRDFCGHGIGRQLHEDPQIPNFGVKDRGLRFKEGMTIAIEPMVNMGGYEVEILSDGWTVVTKDRLPSAHYENTVLITRDGVEILSLVLKRGLNG